MLIGRTPLTIWLVSWSVLWTFFVVACLFGHFRPFGAAHACSLVRHVSALAREVAIIFRLDKYEGWTVGVILFVLPGLEVYRTMLHAQGSGVCNPSFTRLVHPAVAITKTNSMICSSVKCVASVSRSLGSMLPG
jgi:hypothetical protein